MQWSRAATRCAAIAKPATRSAPPTNCAGCRVVLAARMAGSGRAGGGRGRRAPASAAGEPRAGDGLQQPLAAGHARGRSPPGHPLGPTGHRPGARARRRRDAHPRAEQRRRGRAQRRPGRWRAQPARQRAAGARPRPRRPPGTGVLQPRIDRRPPARSRARPGVAGARDRLLPRGGARRASALHGILARALAARSRRVGERGRTGEPRARPRRVLRTRADPRARRAGAGAGAPRRRRRSRAADRGGRAGRRSGAPPSPDGRRHRTRGVGLAGRRGAQGGGGPDGGPPAARHAAADPWLAAELAVWRGRCGLDTGADADAAPPALGDELRGEHAAAAARWDELGCPYDAALALAEGDEADQRRSLDRLHALGAAPAARRVARRLRTRGARAVARGPRPSTRANAAQLTARELEVLRLVADGLRNADIAAGCSSPPAPSTTTSPHACASSAPEAAVRPPRAPGSSGC